jgi:UDP-4-amino-4,6-dideoxy-N-acetyl-beta-L-altrosamine N-acetyltransferase
MIERNRTYQIDKYAFRNFISLSEEEIEIIWKWRNDYNIRKWMRNKDIIPYESHLNFIRSLNNRNDVLYWLAYKQGKPIGVVSFIKIDFDRSESEPGYYLDPALLNTGEGLLFNYYFRYFMHNIIGLTHSVGQILCGNTVAYLISSFFGLQPTSVTYVNDIPYITMVGNKDGFLKVECNTLNKDFVKFVRKKGTINWSKIVEAING